MTLDLLQLKEVTNRLLDHVIEKRGKIDIELKENFYWNVPSDARYNVNEDPSELDVGSLADDWEFISGLLNKENLPVAYQLTELAPLLQYIGEVVGKELAGQGG